MTTIKIDKLIRSKRRTLNVEVGTDTKVTVRVPLRCSNRSIQKFIESHKDWIASKQKYAREHCKQVSPKKYVAGEEFLYLGKAYKLVTAESVDSTLAFNGHNFLISVNQLKNAQELFIQWYKQEASKIITERAKLYSSISGIEYQKVGITNAHQRWGSCSYKGDLSFTWRIVMAPLKVIDCVVVHELVHMKIKGHSKVFWDGVKIMIPEVDYCRNWLKENQNLLSI